MSVGINGNLDTLPVNTRSVTSSGASKEVWAQRLKECMGEGYTAKADVLAAYTGRDKYIAGSYNEEPLIPPIINPPPAVTKRGPNAPYYDAKVSGGPVLRPDARVYTYDNCPSYMRAIIDWSYGRPPGAKNYPKDAEYTKVFYDLCSGNGYKGAFAMDPDPDFIWTPSVKTKTLGAYTSNSNVLGAYTTAPNSLQRTFEDDVTQRQYQATQYETALFDSVKKMTDSMGGEAVIIDGDVIVLPTNREQPAMTQPSSTSNESVGAAQSYIATANMIRQMRLSPVDSDALYRQRLSELGLDTLSAM